MIYMYLGCHIYILVELLHESVLIMYIFSDFKDRLGRELHLQTDSASDNKNKTILGFLGILVHLGIFEEVEILCFTRIHNYMLFNEMSFKTS